MEASGPHLTAFISADTRIVDLLVSSQTCLAMAGVEVATHDGQAKTNMRICALVSWPAGFCAVVASVRQGLGRRARPDEDSTRSASPCCVRRKGANE